MHSSQDLPPAATNLAWPVISPRSTTPAAAAIPWCSNSQPLWPPRSLTPSWLHASLAQHVDGIVCYQDYTALGLILELLNRGVRVPADVAVTGFDNLPIGKAYSIGVTTYAFSPVTVAHQATRLIRARVAGDTGPPVKVLIPGELIVRESSQP